MLDEGGDFLKSARGAVSLNVPRSNNFDFLRFLLASLVIYHHAFPLLYGSGSMDHLGRLTGGAVKTGGVAVDFFFAISGYLIANSWFHSRGVRDFARKRILRIYPGWIAVMILCVLVVGPLGGATEGNYFSNPETYRFFRSLFLRSSYDQLPGVFEDLPYPRAVNGSLWSIRYEIACYILLGVLGWVGLLQRRGMILILFAAAMGTGIVLDRMGIFAEAPSSGLNWPWLIAFYFGGVLFYLFSDSIPFSRPLAGASLVFILILGALGWLLPALVIFGLYLLFYLAFNRSLGLEHFGRYGDFSYGVYLYCFPIQQLLVMYFRPSLNAFTLFLVAFAITLAFAAISWNFIEKPFLKLKPNRKAAKTGEKGATETPERNESPDPKMATGASNRVDTRSPIV